MLGTTSANRHKPLCTTTQLILITNTIIRIIGFTPDISTPTLEWHVYYSQPNTGVLAVRRGCMDAHRGGKRKRNWSVSMDLASCQFTSARQEQRESTNSATRASFSRSIYRPLPLPAMLYHNRTHFILLHGSVARIPAYTLTPAASTPKYPSPPRRCWILMMLRGGRAAAVPYPTELPCEATSSMGPPSCTHTTKHPITPPAPILLCV